MARSQGRSALALALLLAAASAAWAQQIVFNGPVGCAALPPGPPVNLRAEPGDGAVTLRWSAPANGACVDEYRVSLQVLGAAGRSFGSGPQTTRNFSLRVEGLTNGQAYRFTVTAFSQRFNSATGNSASVDATPQEPRPQPGPPTVCSRLLPPSAPTDLKVSNIQATSMVLCFSPPANYGCVDEYRINVKALSNSRAFGAAPLFWSINRGGCVTLDKLSPGTRYQIDVQSWATMFQTGGTASIKATTAAA